MLSERLAIIIVGSGMKQKEFAASIGVTENYISLLLNNKKGCISNSLAKLIEEMYGFSADWILYGEGKMMVDYSKDNKLSPNQKKAIKIVETLSTAEVNAVLEFLSILEKLKEK